MRVSYQLEEVVFLRYVLATYNFIRQFKDFKFLSISQMGGYNYWNQNYLSAYSI